MVLAEPQDFVRVIKYCNEDDNDDVCSEWPSWNSLAVPNLTVDNKMIPRK